MVKGIHNEINIQITENKLPYICKYCNTKGTDILCKIISIIILFIRYNKVIPLHKPERYNILEMNDYAD